MQCFQRAIAVLVAVCLVASSTPAEALGAAPASRTASRLICALQFQALSQPADVFAHGDTERAAVTLDRGATLRRVGVSRVNSRLGMSNLGLVGMIAGLVAAGVLFRPKIVPALALVPWWGWGLATAAGLSAWYLSPNQRLHRIMGLKVTQKLPAHITYLIEKYGSRIVLRLANVKQSNMQSVLTDGLPKVMDLIEQFGLEPFIEIAKEGYGASVIQFGIPEIRELIQTEQQLLSYGKNLSKIARNSHGTAESVFIHGFPNVKSLIERFGIEPFVKIAAFSGENTEIVLASGLPLFEGQYKNDEDMIEYAKQINRAVGDGREIGRGDIVCDNLPSARTSIHSADELKAYVTKRLEQLSVARMISRNPVAKEFADLYGIEPIAEIKRSSGERAIQCLPAVKGLIKKYGIEPFVEIARASGENAGSVFQYGLPLVEDQIKSVEDLIAYGTAFTELVRTSGHVGTIFEIGLPTVKDLIRQYGFQRKLELIAALKRFVENMHGPFTDERQGPYGESLGEYTTNEGYEKEGIEALIAALEKADFSKIRFPGVAQEQPSREADSGLAQAAPALAAGAEQVRRTGPLSPEVEAFLALLHQSDLPDVVLMGGAARDLLLGREPKDFDVTFTLVLNEMEKSLDSSSREWNKALGLRLAPRLERLAQALGVTLKEFLEGKAQFHGLPVHYVGPYWIEETIGSARTIYRSRSGAAFDADGRMYSLDPPTASINSLGITAKGEWVGDPAGYADLDAKRIHTLKPLEKITPEVVLRFILLKYKLGFEFSPETQAVLEHYVTEANKNPEGFTREAARHKEFQERLAEIAQVVPVKELDRWSLTGLLLKTQGIGADQLRRVLDKSEQGIGKLGLVSIIAGLVSAGVLFRPKIVPALALVPWWGWGLASVVICVVWFIASPYQQVRRAANIELGEFPPELKPLIRRFGKQPVIEFAQANGKNIRYAFAYRLPRVLDPFGIGGDLEAYKALAIIGRDSGENAELVFQYGLPLVEDQVKSEKDLKAYGIALAEIARTSGSKASDVFKYGLPAVNGLIKKYGIEPFVEIARASGTNAKDVFVYGLPAVKGLIEQYGIEPFVEIAQASGENAKSVFQYGLPLVEDQVKSVDDLKAKDLLIEALGMAREKYPVLYIDKIVHHDGEYIQRTGYNDSNLYPPVRDESWELEVVPAYDETIKEDANRLIRDEIDQAISALRAANLVDRKAKGSGASGVADGTATPLLTVGPAPSPADAAPEIADLSRIPAEMQAAWNEEMAASRFDGDGKAIQSTFSHDPGRIQMKRVGRFLATLVLSAVQGADCIGAAKPGAWNFSKLPPQEIKRTFTVNGSRGIIFGSRGVLVAPHMVFVPAVQEVRPAEFTSQSLHDLVKLSRGSHDPRLKLISNSLPGWAAVNQFHIHGFLVDETLPMERATLSEFESYADGVSMSTLLDYPGKVAVFSGGSDIDLARHAADFAQYLTGQGVTQTLFMANGKLYIIPYPAQALDGSKLWQKKMGSLEFAGFIPLSRVTDYDNLTEAAIEKEIRDSSLTPEQMSELLRGYRGWKTHSSAPAAANLVDHKAKGSGASGVADGTAMGLGVLAASALNPILGIVAGVLTLSWLIHPWFARHALGISPSVERPVLPQHRHDAGDPSRIALEIAA